MTVKALTNFKYGTPNNWQSGHQINDSQGTDQLTVDFTHYKFFIKETSGEYYNLAMDRFYPAEDGNVWLSFASAERNKLDVEDYIILKKEHDNDKAVFNIKL